jgi:NAD(P)-dependent dehydrogenase (short-subunit alcohol dehydrogenase family)
LNTQTTKPVALVTGAAKRLGQAISLALAEKGWSIALHYNHSTQEAEQTRQAIIAKGVQCNILQADLADAQQVSCLVDQAAQMGPLRCLVNNASLFEFDEATSFSFESLSRHMMANTAAPIVLSRDLYKQIAEGQQGVVVNLLDQKLENLNPDFLSYTLSKSALSTATVMLAQQLSPRLRIVGICPGLTLKSYLQTEEQFEKTHQISPLGRSSKPEDIVQAVLFAIENQAITGTNLVVDGGQHLMSLSRDFSMMNI